MMKQAMMQMLNNNPLFKRAVQMSEGKSNEEIMETAKNICKEKGINYDEALNAFQTQIKGLFGK